MARFFKGHDLLLKNNNYAYIYMSIVKGHKHIDHCALAYSFGTHVIDYYQDFRLQYIISKEISCDTSTHAR